MDGLRQAIARDEDQIYQLIIDLEEATIDRTCFTRIYKLSLSRPSIHYWVYENQDEILGFISVHMQNSLHHAAAIAEIQELIVIKSARGMGIGSKLFQKAKEICLQNDCLQLEVCCNQKRLQSHEFYQSKGMTNNHYKFCLQLK